MCPLMGLFHPEIDRLVREGEGGPQWIVVTRSFEIIHLRNPC